VNIWRAWAQSADNKVRRIVWATSERECRKLSKNEFGDGVGSVKNIEVPTTKAELVEWLNANVNNIAI
jgi:hypothetical protein